VLLFTHETLIKSSFCCYPIIDMKDKFIERYILPKSTNEDRARKEYILNILLVSSIALFSFAFVVRVGTAILGSAFFHSKQNYSLPILTVAAILLCMASLFILSRKGFFRPVSHFLLSVLFCLSVYMSYIWGVQVLVSLLFYVLIIVMGGILVNTRFAFIATFLIALTISAMGLLQQGGIIVADTNWLNEPWELPDSIMVSLFLAVISTVSWLSNREIEKSLIRARRSEAALKRERDSLEVKVEEGVRELKETQLGKMEQLYRFAEFGRLSSGLFHDLINPLNAVALNMEMLKENRGNKDSGAKKYLENALSATKKMEDFVLAVRRQISNQENKESFSLTEEIRQVKEMLGYKLMKANVRVIYTSENNIRINGDAVKWNQVVLNLIVNAIDAFPLDNVNSDKSNTEDKRKIILSLKEESNMIHFSIKDYGMGIPKENFDKIFEPFFTTKKSSGMGIGLSMVKRIVEKDFHGTISVVSEENKGTTFIINLPKIV